MKALRLKKEYRDGVVDLPEFQYVTNEDVFQMLHQVDPNGQILWNEGFYYFTTKSRYKRYLLDIEKDRKSAIYADKLERSKKENVKGIGHPGSKAFKRQVKANLKASLSTKRQKQLAREVANKKETSRKKTKMRKRSVRIQRAQRRA